MPKRIAALAAVLVLALTGCAGVTEDAGGEISAPAATVTVTPSATPTPSESPAAPAAASAASTPSEEAFLDVAIPELAGWGTVLSEQEAIDAGWYACEQIATLPAGSTIADRYKIQPLPGDTEAANGVIVREAIAHFCP